MGLGKSGKIGVLGGVITLVGALLPWWNATASAGPVSVSVPILGIFTIGGILVFLFGILGIVFSAIRKNGMWVLTAIMGVLATLVALLMGAFLPTASVSGGGASASLTAGFGMWVSVVGGVITLLGGLIGFTESRQAPRAAPA